MDRETTLLMQRAAEKLDHHFNGLAQGVDRKVGFILVVYPYGEGPRDANYVASSADGTVGVLKRLVERLEKRPVT